MIQELKNTIQDLRIESTQFNANDVLVNIERSDKNLFFTTDELKYKLDELPKKILTDANKIKKESGVNALCVVNGIVNLTVGEKTIHTPLILTPLEFKINKIYQTIVFDRQDEEQFINPFLLFHLENSLGLKTQETQDISEFKAFLAENGLNISEENISIIGNFHHHRYQIVKELDDLIQIDVYSSPLSNLLGFSDNSEPNSIPLIPDNLFFSDTDHEKVFDSISEKDTVIQGPPGTGKSQVLSNVLGKLLAKNKTTIVVSEKRAALEVLKKKLNDFKLDQLCFIATTDYLSHTFFEELKSTWNYFENLTTEHTTNIRLSEQYSDQLQMTLDLLSQKELIGGISFAEFFEDTLSINLSRYTYNSQVDTIDVFKKNRNTIESIYDQKLNSILGNIKHSTLISSEFNNLDKKIEAWIKTLLELQQTFSIEDWIDLDKLTKEAIQCQIFENEYYKRYSDLFKPNSKPQKTFLRLRKKYLKANVALEKIKKNNSHWKIIPSESEATSMLNSFKNSSFFGRIKTKKRWKSITHLPFKTAVEELNLHLNNIEEINNFTQITIDFCELGIDNPAIDVEQIYQTLVSISNEEWQRLSEIPSEQRSKITSFHSHLENLQRDFKTYLNLNHSTNIVSFLNQFKKDFGTLVSQAENLKSLSQNSLNGLKLNSNFKSFEGQIYASHYAQFKDRFPVLANFSMHDLAEKVNEITLLQKQEFKDFAKMIEENISEKFKEYHALLSASSRKLTEEEKSLKTRLRKGKSILVKEFSKTRSHPTLREIYNSEARDWIKLLKPIWLSNPSQLAKCFPMEEGLFDVAIFDEASQIPLQSALGAVHRSKRIVIAGDEHQMGPSNYFKSGSKEPMDLLHQGSFHLNKIPLSHHYRSKHPDLIAFSNKHIYNNQLKAFPSFQAETPIKHVYCENGIFTDRQNQIEAKEIAKEIEVKLKSKKNIGIVAFSEEQLHTILKQLTPKSQQQLSEQIEDNTAFFKTLENVQGDECDHLLISFGYGKNEDGDFHMRFGPINTSNGRKRLNVLLTRAKESISFYCSIKSEDFKLSDNESIHLLKQWIHFSESYVEKFEFNFPHLLKPQIKKNTLLFTSIQEKVVSAKELVTLQNVLNARGWIVEYK